MKPGFYQQLAEKTKQFTDTIIQHSISKKYPFKIFVNQSIFWLAFTSQNEVNAAEEIDPKSMDKFKILHAFMLDNGVYFGPSGYEVGFISAAHSEADLEKSAQVICNGLDLVFEQVLSPVTQ